MQLFEIYRGINNLIAVSNFWVRLEGYFGKAYNW